MGSDEGDVARSPKALLIFPERVEQTNTDPENIIAKHGETWVPTVDADRLDGFRQFERERVHLLLIDDAARGLADVTAGRHLNADDALSLLERAREADRSSNNA